MKMIVSAFVLFVLFLSSSVFNPCPIGAQETVEFQAIEKPVANAQIDLPREFGTVSSKIEAGIDGAFVPLYPTFDFPSEALSSIRRNEALQAVMKAYALDPIDGNNWARYAELSMALLDFPDRPAWYCESDERVSELRLFFDIFENDERNIEAITRLESADPGEEARELMLTLPSASFEELSGWTEIASARHSTAVRSFDSNAAFEYALTYSTKRNPKYPSFDSDCTNFASQILESGGEPQVSGGDYNSVHVGWWHRNDWGQHLQSRTWTLADEFMKYFGVKNCGSDHLDFSFTIQEGDFIALDFGKDGDWDHVGYVMVPGNGTGPGGYRDYHVAQHTQDYHADVSDKINGWETHDGKSNYGYVRR